jgi:hypothetical protein
MNNKKKGDWPIVLLFGDVFVWFGDKSKIIFKAINQLLEIKHNKTKITNSFSMIDKILGDYKSPLLHLHFTLIILMLRSNEAMSWFATWQFWGSVVLQSIALQKRKREEDTRARNS